MRATFLHHEAETILGIPLSLGMSKDSQSRAWTKNGEFSVKSAYGMATKVLKVKSKRDGGECLDSRHTKKLWKKI